MFRLALLLLLPGGCEAAYLPPGPPRSVEGPQVVGVAEVIDRRDPAVAELVGRALRNTLAARSLLATTAPRYLLSATVLRYSWTQVPTERAAAKFHLTLKDAAGHVIYGDDVAVEHTLQQAIDDTIDKPSFRAALKS